MAKSLDVASMCSLYISEKVTHLDILRNSHSVIISLNISQCECNSGHSIFIHTIFYEEGGLEKPELKLRLI